jgi:hypothetical protein
MREAWFLIRGNQLVGRRPRKPLSTGEVIFVGKVRRWVRQPGLSKLTWCTAMLQPSQNTIWFWSVLVPSRHTCHQHHHHHHHVSQRTQLLGNPLRKF